MTESKDMIIVGAGVISTTVASMFNELVPNWNIDLYERLDCPGIESSNERNNAGTGHAALCELNYTVRQPDGTIDIEKAKEINEQFEISKQFWGHLVESGQIKDPRDFIHPLPHISFVRGKNNVQFLKERYEKMKDFPMFDDIEYTEDIEVMRKWIPLMMQGRFDDGLMAASKIDEGTDVNYGELTRKMAHNLQNDDSNVNVNYNHEVQDFKRLSNGKWQVKIKDLANNKVLLKKLTMYSSVLVVDLFHYYKKLVSKKVNISVVSQSLVNLSLVQIQKLSNNMMRKFMVKSHLAHHQ